MMTIKEDLAIDKEGKKTAIKYYNKNKYESKTYLELNHLKQFYSHYILSLNIEDSVIVIIDSINTIVISIVLFELGFNIILINGNIKEEKLNSLIASCLGKVIISEKILNINKLKPKIIMLKDLEFDKTESYKINYNHIIINHNHRNNDNSIQFYDEDNKRYKKVLFKNVQNFITNIENIEGFELIQECNFIFYPIYQPTGFLFLLSSLHWKASSILNSNNHDIIFNNIKENDRICLICSQESIENLVNYKEKEFFQQFDLIYCSIQNPLSIMKVSQFNLKYFYLTDHFNLILTNNLNEHSNNDLFLVKSLEYKMRKTEDYYQLVMDEKFVFRYKFKTICNRFALTDELIKDKLDLKFLVYVENIVNNFYLIEKSFVYVDENELACLILNLDYKEACKVELNKIIDKIFYFIENLNEKVKFNRSLVYISSIENGKKIVQLNDGTINRELTYRLFKKEIEELYEEYESNENLIENKFSLDGIKSIIEEIFISIFKIPFLEEDNFFKLGLDSLRVVQFRKEINIKLKIKISIQDIYENNNLDLLGKYIFDLINGIKNSKSIDYYQSKVNSMLSKYLPEIKEVTKLELKSLKIAIVTGGTGSLGTFLIKELISEIDILYVLVRDPIKELGINRFKESLKKRKIFIPAKEFLKIKILRVDLSLEDLGLGSIIEEFNVNNLRIFHVGWRMDFLKNLEEFEDCILGTVNLLKLASKFKNHCQFNFISTVGASLPSESTNNGLIQEWQLSLNLKNINMANGYNLSKLIAEKLCHEYSLIFKFPLNILRVGQLSGDTNYGIWNHNEYLPLLIKAAYVMKVIPSLFSIDIAWVPVNIAAKSIFEIAFSDCKNISYYHIVNPDSGSWDIIFNLLKTQIKELKRVSSTEYIECVESISKYQDVEFNPIVSLLDYLIPFFNCDMSISFDLYYTLAKSNSIKYCPKVTPELFNKSLDYWKSLKFI